MKTKIIFSLFAIAMLTGCTKTKVADAVFDIHIIVPFKIEPQTFEMGVESDIPFLPPERNTKKVSIHQFYLDQNELTSNDTNSY